MPIIIIIIIFIIVVVVVIEHTQVAKTSDSKMLMTTLGSEFVHQQTKTRNSSGDEISESDRNSHQLRHS